MHQLVDLRSSRLPRLLNRSTHRYLAVQSQLSIAKDHKVGIIPDVHSTQVDRNGRDGEKVPFINYSFCLDIVLTVKY